MREVKLNSGAILKVQPASFAVSKALYQALLREMKAVSISTQTEMAALYKDLFCIGFSSPEIEACLWECMKRCLYNTGKGDFKIEADTFEPVACRDDYVKVCVEVSKENVLPFFKSLYAEYLEGQATAATTRP
jgi:hypothetical protein